MSKLKWLRIRYVVVDEDGRFLIRFSENRFELHDLKYPYRSNRGRFRTVESAKRYARELLRS